MADLYDALADTLVGGAQEAFVRELTERLAAQLESDCDNPDVYGLALRYARREALATWAKYEQSVSEAAYGAFKDALGEVDEETVKELSRAHGWASRGIDTASGQARVEEAARGVAAIVRRQNVALASTMAESYYEIVADAVTRSEMGESKRAVMERAYAALADAGIETVDYASGVHTTIDAAVRRHVVTQQSQCRADLLKERMDEWDHDLVYTSAHFGARPSHQPWQGHVFSRSGKDKRYPSLAAGTGYGTVTGLCGANCRHTFYPYSEGLTKLPNTDFSEQEKLTGMTSDEYYAAQQRQRALERRVRKVKREIAVGQAHGCDMAAKRAELGVAQRRLREHVSANKLVRDYSRERAYGVAEQPRALGTGATVEARERFIPKGQKAKGTAYDVRRKAVNGKAYREKYDRMGVPKRAARSLYEQAREILRDRDGTDGERMAVVAWSNGAKVTDTFGRPVAAHKCGLTAAQVKKASKVPGGVVLLRNHPASARPSMEDIATVAANGWVKCSVVACHDGTVYVIQRAKGEVVEAYREFRRLAEDRALSLGIIDTTLVEQMAEDALYEANRRRQWFKIIKL